MLEARLHEILGCMYNLTEEILQVNFYDSSEENILWVLDEIYDIFIGGEWDG